MERAGRILESRSRRLTSDVVEAISNEATRQLRLVQQVLNTHIPKLYARIEMIDRHASRAAGLAHEVLQKLEKLHKEIDEVKKQLVAKNEQQ